jgi:hypothetical protein
VARLLLAKATNKEVRTMNHNTSYQHSATLPLRMTTSLRDGLITICGLAVATGGFFYAEIAMWWLGA